jgi:hypothetical protein
MRIRRGVRYNLSQFARGPAMAEKRRLVVRRDDVLVLNGFEVDASTLIDITQPDKRILWAFVKSEDGTEIRPVCYTEEHCIWLMESDLVRDKADVV